MVINGWTSSFFSPLLYVLCIEVLACAINANPAIEGVALPGSDRTFKCSGNADDTSIAVTTEASIAATFAVYGQYEQASKGIWLGAWKKSADNPFGLQ